MTHQEYLAIRHSRTVSVGISYSDALKAAKHLPVIQQNAFCFWAWFNAAAIVGGIALCFYKLWVGILFLLTFPPMVRHANRKTLRDWVIQRADEDEAWFRVLHENGMLVFIATSGKEA